MNTLLTAAAVLALTATPAFATLSVTATDDGVPITLTITTPTAGSINATGTDANFSVNLSGSGSPDLPDPALGSTTLDIHHLGTGTDTLIVQINQTGLSGVTGFHSQTEATVNGLIGSPGPSTLTQLVNGAALDTFNFPASSAAQTGSANDLIPAAILSDAQSYNVQFTGPAAALDTISFVAAGVAVPEPSTLMLLGGALLGFGALIRRRRSSNLPA